MKKQRDGSLKEKATRLSKEEVIADDPSEAVSSDRILDTAEKYLETLTCNKTGGTLLQPLLHGIADNFDRSELGRACLKLLIFFEDYLIERDVIPSDYILYVGRKRLDPEAGSH